VLILGSPNATIKTEKENKMLNEKYNFRVTGLEANAEAKEFRKWAETSAFSEYFMFEESEEEDGSVINITEYYSHFTTQALYEMYIVAKSGDSQLSILNDADFNGTVH
jgi:hypothetical protein